MGLNPTEGQSVNIPHETERVVDPHVAQWFVRTATLLFAAYAVFVGIAILVGGEQRWAGVSYQVALHTPGAPASWGFTILAAGCCVGLGAVTGRTRLTALGGLIGCIWATLFAVSFFVTSMQFPEANNTAFPAYAGIAVIFALIGGVNLVMDPPAFVKRLARSLPKRKG